MPLHAIAKDSPNHKAQFCESFQRNVDDDAISGHSCLVWQDDIQAHWYSKPT
jgi:hypothetical protein